MKQLLFIILFFNIFISSVALSGPLDIEKIKKECLSDTLHCLQS